MINSRAVSYGQKVLYKWSVLLLITGGLLVVSTMGRFSLFFVWLVAHKIICFFRNGV